MGKLRVKPAPTHAAVSDGAVDWRPDSVQKMQLMQSIREQQLQQTAPLPMVEVGAW